MSRFSPSSRRNNSRNWLRKWSNLWRKSVNSGRRDIWPPVPKWTSLRLEIKHLNPSARELPIFKSTTRTYLRLHIIWGSRTRMILIADCSWKVISSRPFWLISFVQISGRSSRTSRRLRWWSIHRPSSSSRLEKQYYNSQSHIVTRCHHSWIQRWNQGAQVPFILFLTRRAYSSKTLERSDWFSRMRTRRVWGNL